MQDSSIKNSLGDPIPSEKSINRKQIWARELFLIFYLLFFIAKFLDKISDSSFVYYLFTACKYTYIPGMLFAAGYHIGFTNKKISSKNSFRTNMFFHSLFCLSMFYFFGLAEEILLDRRALYSTIKDLLAMIRLPNISAIFLTLTLLYLFAGIFWKNIDRLPQKKYITAILSVIGFMFVFLPKNLIGYGIIGAMTGCDNFGAIPLFPYLFVVFFGIYFATDKKATLIQKKYVIYMLFLLIAACGFAILHFKSPALLLFGVICAWIICIFSLCVFNIYYKVERFAVTIYKHLLAWIISINEKQKHSLKTRYFLYFIGYTMLFFVMSVFIFFPYIQEGRSLIWSIDGLGQYVPKIYRFISDVPSIIKDILHGNMNFTQYDFSSGLGSTIAFSYDPIYWLYLLVKPSQIESAYSAMIILRYYLAGLSMSALVLYFKNNTFSAYVSSMVYAFSGYAIYAGTKHGQFLTPLILLPVLVIAMEELISKKKWYLMTIFSAISLLCSYYFLYMNTLAIGIYFVLRILCNKEYRNFKTFFTRGLIIVGSYILGASIGIISIFTSFAAYMGSSRTEGGGLDTFLSTTSLFYRPEWISDTFISFISDSFTPGMWLKLGFAPIALFAIILLFTRNNKKELKPLFLIFTSFMLFPIFGYIFSGFSSVNNRWCYIYACLIAFILAEMINKLTKLTANELIAMTSLTLLYAGIVFFSTKYRLNSVFGAFGFLSITLIVLLLINAEQIKMPKVFKKPLLFIITMCCILLNANLFMTAESDTGRHMNTYVKKGTSYNQMTTTPLKNLPKIAKDDSAFYRSTNLTTTGNSRSSSLILGYNDLSTFTSTLSSGIVDYNSAMGNCDWNVVSIYSYNGRTIMNELAGVKYLGVVDNNKLTIPYGYKKVFSNKMKRKHIYENEYALPLGYTYDSILPASEASKFSAAEKQELTLLTAIVDDKVLEKNSNLNQTKSFSLSSHKVKMTNVKLNGVKIDEKEGSIISERPDSTITFHFEGEPNSETYISLKGDIFHEKDAKEHFLKTTIKADGTNYIYKFRIDSYSTGQNEFLFNLGYHKDAINSCTIKFPNKGIINFEDLSIYTQPMTHYPDNINALKENVLENIKTDTNYVSGDITTDTDKMLCITLPYQKGWTAYIDGQKAEISRVNYQYMGLNITPGTHHIELKYQLPGIRYAFLITGAGLGIFILIIIFNHIRKKRV